MWPAEWTYYRIDPDPRVLEVEVTDKPIERLVSDTAALPLPDNSADVVLMQCVSHHLDNSIWPISLREAKRVLKPGGSFIFVDGVWTKQRWISRAFWERDAGHYREPQSNRNRRSPVNSGSSTSSGLPLSTIRYFSLRALYQSEFRHPTGDSGPNQRLHPV
jgi:SAM-dependent methyltransferase